MSRVLGPRAYVSTACRYHIRRRAVWRVPVRVSKVSRRIEPLSGTPLLDSALRAISRARALPVPGTMPYCRPAQRRFRGHGLTHPGLQRLLPDLLHRLA